MTRVVVGVSASSGSPNALPAAVEEARRRDAELVAVQAWRPPRPPASPGGHPPGVSRDVDASLAEAEVRLRSQVTAVLGDDAQVICKVVEGGPRSVLRNESENADLLIVDAPAMHLGAPSKRLVHRLIEEVSCPILVMPQPAG